MCLSRYLKLTTATEEINFSQRPRTRRGFLLGCFCGFPQGFPARYQWIMCIFNIQNCLKPFKSSGLISPVIKGRGDKKVGNQESLERVGNIPLLLKRDMEYAVAVGCDVKLIVTDNERLNRTVGNL